MQGPAYHSKVHQASLRRRIQVMVWILVIGMLASGLTALPLQTELDLLCQWLGADSSIAPSGLVRWVVKVRDALHQVYAQYPFMCYGTDWLAFAHIGIAILFCGTLVHPVRNSWIFTWTMIVSVLVIPWALICGEVRNIPLGWRLIDCAFGVIAYVPAALARKWCRELERMRAGVESLNR